uniref:Protein LAS1 n=1 Tax=Ceratitis capitata TaxID=7213 RepID=W8BP10_CERCA
MDSNVKLSGEMEQQNLRKRRTVVGPWKDVKEFRSVYEHLYGEDTDAEQQKQALSQINIWSLRRSTQCPAGVLATKTIFEVQCLDKSEGQEAITENVLQTLYASAIIRFFNFMSSTMQTHNMRSMYDTASMLGLPSFVVDLRHLCAHGQVLPPLDLLRSTVSNCIVWLRDYYWVPQLESMCDVEASKIRRKDKTLFEENVTKLLVIYDAALECYCKGAHNMKTGKRHISGKRLAELRTFYAEKKLTSLKDTLEFVLKELIILVKRETGIKDMSEIFIEALQKMKFFFTVGDTYNADEPLEILIGATHSFFRMLAVYGFIEDVFYSFIGLAENTYLDEIRRSGASFWATRIAAGFVAFRKCKQMYKAELEENPHTKDFDFTSLNLENISKKMRRHLIYAGVDIKCTPIFGDSMRRPWVWIVEKSYVEEKLSSINKYNGPIIKGILPLVEPPLTTSEIRGISLLIDAYLGKRTGVKKVAAEPVSKDDTIHTASELLQALKKQSGSGDEKMHIDENEAVSENKGQFGIWTLEKNDEITNWSVCPLGRLPWET